jgi:ABC-type multidrug transport system ATPase subunit
MDSAIFLQNLSFSYSSYPGSANKIVNNFCLSIKRGEIVGVVGRNASGKTTILNIMRGSLIP